MDVLILIVSGVLDLYGLIIYHVTLQVCVDIFITAQTYVDIASTSVIPRTTGGQVLENDVTHLLDLWLMSFEYECFPFSFPVLCSS